MFVIEVLGGNNVTLAHKIQKPLETKFTAIRVLRGNKAETLRFRVDPRQKQYWLKALAQLGVEDFSSYARSAVDRAISQDLRSMDPKWQDFVKAIQPKAKEILGTEVSDSAKDRIENMAEINRALEKHNLRK